MRVCVKISSRQKVKHFPLPALLWDLSPPLHHSTGTVLFFKLAPPKQHSFTVIPLALKATLPSMYHLRRELRFTSKCAYMYVARFTIPGKKKSNPLIRGPCTFWMYPVVGSLLQCNLLQILERLIFNVAEKSLVLQNVRKFSFLVTP